MIAKCNHRARITTLSGGTKPTHAFRFIRVAANTVEIGDTEIGHRGRVACACATLKPRERLTIVASNRAALCVHRAKRSHRLCVASFGGATLPLRGARVVTSRAATSFEVRVRDKVHRTRVACFGRAQDTSGTIRANPWEHPRPARSRAPSNVIARASPASAARR
jgi:hypothetical protein